MVFSAFAVTHFPAWSCLRPHVVPALGIHLPQRSPATASPASVQLVQGQMTVLNQCAGGEAFGKSTVTAGFGESDRFGVNEALSR